MSDKSFLKVDSWVELRSIEFPLVKQQTIYDNVFCTWLIFKRANLLEGVADLEWFPL